MKKNKYKATSLIILLFFGSYSNAYAYLDAGTVSYFLTIIIAGLAGASYMIKIYWLNLINFLKKIFKITKNNSKDLPTEQSSNNEKQVH
jgi:hypothetical protein